MFIGLRAITQYAAWRVHEDQKGTLEASWRTLPSLIKIRWKFRGGDAKYSGAGNLEGRDLYV
ncbi:MAG: hypothetical protein ACLRL6_13665 [Clostridium sp.]